MITKFWPSKKNEIIVFFVLMFLSLIPVVYTWGRLPIGGDVFIFINSDGLKKYLYQWITVGNGQYFVLNFFPFYLFYKIFELFRLSLYQISSLLLFSLSFIAGIGIYKLVKLFFEKGHFSLYVLPIVFYLLSPALLNGWVYGYVYSFAPWFIYFVFKVIKSRRLEVKDIIFMSFLLSFLSADLPNPKYIFYLAVISLVSILSAFFLKLIDFKFITNNLVKLILFFLLSAYLSLPLFHFASNYSPELYGVHTKAGYADTGKMMDYGSATVVKMVRLRQDNMNIETSHKIEYNSNLVVGVLSYLPIVLIIIGLLIIKDRYYLIFTLLSVCFLFFAVGPNKPFGLVYELFVSNFKYLAFLRTTAGAVFFLSMFYSVLLAFILNHLAGKSKIIYPLILLSILIVGYPFLNGDYYKNRKIGNPYIDDKQYGQRIPRDYFDIKKDIDAVKRDVRIVYSVPYLSYINTTWGFFGFPIYNFIYNSNNIGFKNVFSNLANHNVGLIYLDKSLIDSSGTEAIANEEKSILVKKTDLIELRKVKDDYFLPHFYIPKNIIYSNGDIESLVDIMGFGDYEIRSGIYLEHINGLTDLKINGSEELKNRADEFFIKSELEDKVSEEELGMIAKPEEIFLPYVRQKPGSLFYPLVLKKEKYDRWKARRDPEKLFEKHLFYASKRISEIMAFGANERVLANYKKEMTDVFGILKKLKQEGSKDFVKLLAKYEGTLWGHRNKINELTNYSLTDWDNAFQELEGQIEGLKIKRDFSGLVYKVEILKKERYEIYVRDNDDTGNKILNTRGTMPRITFVKINPTKYRVKVEGAVDPYTLIFSESYHNGWKAYVNQTQNSELRTQNYYSEVVASYFNGEIKEGTHKNIFLDRNTFETWGKKTISEERHLSVNGYANSWYIKPEDVGGKQDYELIIEFAPQRLSYVGLGISLATLFGCLGYLGYSFVRKKLVISNEEN